MNGTITSYENMSTTNGNRSTTKGSISGKKGAVIKACTSNRLGVNVEGLRVTPVDESVVISTSGADSVFDPVVVPRARSSQERKPMVTLVPPLDDEGRERNLPPPISATAMEKLDLKDVALSSVEPEETSVAQESDACVAKESLVDISNNLR